MLRRTVRLAACRKPCAVRFSHRLTQNPADFYGEGQRQYDRTLIEYKDECYVQTVAEAEALGFRRAFRWKGLKEAK